MSVAVDVDVASIAGYQGKTVDEKIQDVIVRDDMRHETLEASYRRFDNQFRITHFSTAGLQ